MSRTKHQRFDDPRDVLTATAPYNFISLPEQFRSADVAPETQDHSMYAPARLSGWIDLKITTLTELFIRGTHTAAEYADLDLKKERPKPQTEFFRPADLGRIPGSTLRGLTRSLVEILSDSCVTDIKQEPMFYRTMDGSSLSAFYTDQMVQRKNLRPSMKANNGKDCYNSFATDVRAGYIVKRQGGYELYPIEKSRYPEFFRIEQDDIDASLLAAWGNPDDPEWKREPIWFRPQMPANQRHSASILEYGKILSGECVPRDPTASLPSGWEEGWLVVSGFVKKKHLHWIVGPPADTPLKVDNLADVIREYEREGLTKDVKDETFSVLPQNLDEYLPCFYKIEGKRLLAIGHTGMMRLPYKNTPAALVDQLVPGTNEPGLAERIFGVSGAEEGSHAGFVRFEDALLTDQTQLTQTPVQIRVLGEPHPTTFPHYVCQYDVREATKEDRRTGRIEYFVDSKKLQHWDDSQNAHTPTPRGTKMFWHRRNVDWTEEDGVISDSHSAPIAPAKENACFRGRVRFDNLTEVQLGALLCALQLPTDAYAHKLGMGKPYGLGSVRIECTLYHIDRASRYQFLFTLGGDALNDGTSETTGQISRYQMAFVQWMMSSEGATAETFWKQPRLRELEVMLRFTDSPHPQLTRYIDGPGDSDSGGEGKRGKFYLRRVLPGPLQVVGEPEPTHRTARAETASARSQSAPPSAVQKPGGSSGPPQAARAGEVPVKTPAVNVTPPMPLAPLPVAPQAAYKVGEKIKVKILPRTGNTGPVQLPNGNIVSGQNTTVYQVNQEVNLWVEEVQEGRVTKLSKNRVSPA